MGWKKKLGDVLGMASEFIPGGSIVKGGFELLKRKGLSPEAAAEIDKLTLENEQELNKYEYDFKTKIEVAAHESFKALMQSGDKYTRRWRPTFGYAVTGLIVNGYGIYPYFHDGRVIDLPNSLLELFGALLLLAIGSRTWEKVVDRNRKRDENVSKKNS